MSKLEGRRVAWSAVGVDVYGRVVGDLRFRDGARVNAEVIRQGYARAYTGFAFEGRDVFERLEREARAAGRGLWAEVPADQPETIPWDDDANGRISCAEARRHGIAPVRRGHPAYDYMRDGDGDGVACEGRGQPPARARADRTEPETSGRADGTPSVAGTRRWDDNGNGRISCVEARRHRIAPVPRGHPAYDYMRDGDGDGVACE